MATSTPTNSMEPRLLRGGLQSFSFSMLTLESLNVNFSFEKVSILFSMQNFSKFGNSLCELLLPLQLAQNKNTKFYEERLFSSTKNKNFKIRKPSSTKVFLYLFLVKIKLIRDMFYAYYKLLFDLEKK